MLTLKQPEYKGYFRIMAATGILFTVLLNAACSRMDTHWDKTFKKNENVLHEKVTYQNRYGIRIVADLYKPRNSSPGKKQPALVVGHPYGGVKEQGAGIYAQEMAARGFITLAYDVSFNGESGGMPRHVSSPEIFVEDFSAAVDYLGNLSSVDRNRIGAIGICGSGAFSLKAAQVDLRIKAVATASMYDMSRLTRNGWKDSMSESARNSLLAELAAKRWTDFKNGSPEYIPAFPESPTDAVPAKLNPIAAEFYEYYGMKRGHHPRAQANFTTTSQLAFINFPLMNYVKSVSPRPVLFIMGEKAHSRYFTEDVYKMAAQPKELHVVPGARHIDLYDRSDMIPFDKLTEFFKKNLSSGVDNES